MNASLLFLPKNSHREVAFSQGERKCLCFQRFITFHPTSCSPVFMSFSYSVQNSFYSLIGQKAKPSKVIILIFFLDNTQLFGQKRSFASLFFPVFHRQLSFALTYTVHAILSSQKNKTWFINCREATRSSSSWSNRAETWKCRSTEIPQPACLESLAGHTVKNHAYMALIFASPVDEQ